MRVILLVLFRKRDASLHLDEAGRFVQSENNFSQANKYYWAESSEFQPSALKAVLGLLPPINLEEKT